MMSEQPSSHRRDFLTGKTAGQVAADAIQQAADHVAEFADALAPRALATIDQAAGYVVTLRRRAMACDFEVCLNADRDSRGSVAAMQALDLIDELESQMTIYRDTSEVLEINREAANAWVDVESRLFDVLQLSDRLHCETQGAFDLTGGPLSRIWGFDQRKGKLPTDDQIAEALKFVGWDKVELDVSADRIRFLRSGVDINLNSIGKGYALDRAAELLADSDVDDFLIHGGRSTLLARGSRAGRQGWTTRLRHPLRPRQIVAEFQLEDQALSTSGSATQSFVIGGKRYGHLLDPRSGWPADAMHSATVVAPTGAEADALSTAFYVMGADQVQEYCTAHPHIRALLVLPTRRVGEVEVAMFNVDSASPSG